MEGGEDVPGVASSPEEAPAVSGGYRFFRGLIRIWFTLFFRKIRLLYREALPSSDPSILLVSHPASFLDALILVATVERQVHCLLDSKHLQGIWRRLLARALGMIPGEPEGEGWERTLEACCEVLGERGAVVVFAEHSPTTFVSSSALCPRVARLAVEAETRHSGQLGLAVFPVYMFLPVKRSHSSELLIDLGAPVFPHDLISAAAKDPQEQVRALGSVLEKKCGENAFRLPATDVSQFLSDLEEVLRRDLEEDWAARANWKQKTEGFELSRLVVEWVQQLNVLNPGRLVALREAVEAYREARRRWSLQELEVEAAPRLKSPVRRTAVWAESVVGLPIALYGLLNHALIWLTLSWTGLLKRGERRDRTLDWVIRTLVVLGFYAGQILVSDQLLGRAAAGYYAPSLPLTGAYLWRYRWLLRHRTRLAYLVFRLPAQAEKVRRIQKELAEEITRAMGVYSGISEAVH